MSRILEKFEKFYRSEKDDRVDEEALLDMQKFMSTRAYGNLRNWLTTKKKEIHWTPGMSQETAASNLVAQTVYDELLAELDRMGQYVTEHLRDGQEG